MSLRGATGTAPLVEAAPHVPTSMVLEHLIRAAPAGQVSLAWLTGQLRTRSFGIVLLLLGVCGLLPVVSPAAGLVLAIPASQMIRAHPAPVFPRRIAQRSVPTARLAAMLLRIIPALRFLERFIRPRWATPFKATKRVVGGVVLLLGLALLAPLPLSNVPVSLTVVLIAFAYLEEDGILLAAALLVALGLFAVGLGAAWGTVAGLLRLAE